MPGAAVARRFAALGAEPRHSPPAPLRAAAPAPRARRQAPGRSLADAGRGVGRARRRGTGLDLNRGGLGVALRGDAHRGRAGRGRRVGDAARGACGGGGGSVQLRGHPRARRPRRRSCCALLRSAAPAARGRGQAAAARRGRRVPWNTGPQAARAWQRAGSLRPHDARALAVACAAAYGTRAQKCACAPCTSAARICGASPRECVRRERPAAAQRRALRAAPCDACRSGRRPGRGGE